MKNASSKGDGRKKLNWKDAKNSGCKKHVRNKVQNGLNSSIITLVGTSISKVKVKSTIVTK
jgi:hypothetical protein